MTGPRPGASHPPNRLARLAARALRATRVVDRAATWFDRARSKIVVTFASDAVLDAYADFAYTSSADYDPAADRFRGDWFPWEAEAVRRFFPAAPGRVLVGGAGGGREALLLANAAYDVVAFDPVRTLIAALSRAAAGASLESFVGRYEALPAVQSLDGRVLSLEGMGPFDAGVMGWGSLAHVRRDADRVEAVRGFTSLVRGPVLVSVYPELWAPGQDRLARWLHADGAVFSPGLGRVQTFDEVRFRDLLERAGVDVLALDCSARVDNWPHAVVRGRPGSR